MLIQEQLDEMVRDFLQLAASPEVLGSNPTLSSVNSLEREPCCPLWSSPARGISLRSCVHKYDYLLELWFFKFDLFPTVACRKRLFLSYANWRWKVNVLSNPCIGKNRNRASSLSLNRLDIFFLISRACIFDWDQWCLIDDSLGLHARILVLIFYTFVLLSAGSLNGMHLFHFISLLFF